MAALMVRSLSSLRLSLQRCNLFSSNNTNEEVELFENELNKEELVESVQPEIKLRGVNGINDCPKSCLCSNNINFDYKNVRLLSQFVSSQTGMMYPRTYTKICMTKQREIAKAIKRSRTMGFMPYTSKIQEYVNDPELFFKI